MNIKVNLKFIKLKCETLNSFVIVGLNYSRMDLNKFPCMFKLRRKVKKELLNICKVSCGFYLKLEVLS